MAKKYLKFQGGNFLGRQYKECETRYTILELELMAAAEALTKLKLYTTRSDLVTLLVDNKCALALINSGTLMPT